MVRSEAAGPRRGWRRRDIGGGQVVSRRRFLHPGEEEEEEEEEETKVSASDQPGRGGGEAGLWNSDSEPNHCFEGCRGDR